MPNKCCVIGCNTAYKTVHHTGSTTKNHLFGIPKNDELKNKWLEAIGRKNFKPGTWSVVCYKHFQESDIIKGTEKAVGKKGEVISFPLKVKLKEGAVPSINMNNVGGKKYTRRVNKNSKELSSASIVRTSRRKRSHSKPTLKSIPQNSSDEDDIPLQKIKNQIIDCPDKKIVEDTDNFQEDSDKTLKKKFKILIEDYEQLKEKSRCLDHEIKLLETVNIKLKSDIFKC